MGAALLLQLLFITLSIFSLETSALRKKHPGRLHHTVNPSIPKPSYQFPHERLLGGAGCTVPLPSEVKAPKENVWVGLTEQEYNDLNKWLLEQKELNLSRGYHQRENTIYDIDLMPPNKTDVLRYLDKNGTAPARYASVVLSVVAPETPIYKNILVGPLPVSNASTWQPLNYPFTRKTPIRNLYGHQDYEAYSKFNKKITDSVKNITEDLWNLTARNWEAYCGQTPTWQYDDKSTEWSQYWGYSTTAFDSASLLPLGLFYKAEYDLFYSDPSTWKFGGWLYNDIYYATTEDFKKAYYSPGFEKFGPNIDGPWTSTDQRGPVLPLDTEPPPMPVAKRARFLVDFRRKYVEWLGFSFYLVMRDAGLALYDVRFKGERIIYELALQEALGHYAGNDPSQSGTAYLEGLGFVNELFPGYDCPTYATYLNTTAAGSFESKEINSICLFEFDADYPIQRHGYQSVTKNIYLVVRTITTVGNYDYMLTYEFYMDGSIQVVVRFAGYIQAAYFAKNHEYGYHIHDFLSGSMHDHVLNFKADLDILGTRNTMELVTVTPVTQNYVWADHPRNTMKLLRKNVKSEDESRLKWAGNGATQYRIINTDKPNRYGEYRGYRILPSQGTIHLAINNSSNLVNAANWAYDDLAITKQKDTEPRSGNWLNDQDVYNPLVNFDDFFDGDNLEQEDLVLWFNLGVHHIPHTGDLPNTVYTTAHSAIQITPSNYFLYDQSRETVNMARIAGSANHTVVKTFGQAHQVCMANLSDIGYGYGYYK